MVTYKPSDLGLAILRHFLSGLEKIKKKSFPILSMC